MTFEVYIFGINLLQCESKRKINNLVFLIFIRIESWFLNSFSLSLDSFDTIVLISFIFSFITLTLYVSSTFVITQVGYKDNFSLIFLLETF